MQIIMPKHLLQDEAKESHGTIKIEQEAESRDLTIYSVNVVVIRGYSLTNLDYFDLSDPYCEVNVGGVIINTREIRNCLDPVWKEKMKFYLAEEPKEIIFTVKDDTNLESDFIGLCQFSLDDMFATEKLYDGKLTLTNKKEERGKLRVRISCKTYQATQKYQGDGKILTNKLLDVFAAAEKLENKQKLSERIRNELEGNEALRDDILDEFLEREESSKKKEQEIISLKQKLKETDRRVTEVQETRAKIQLDLNDMKKENEKLRNLVENMRT